MKLFSMLLPMCNVSGISARTSTAMRQETFCFSNFILFVCLFVCVAYTLFDILLIQKLLISLNLYVVCVHRFVCSLLWRSSVISRLHTSIILFISLCTLSLPPSFSLALSHQYSFFSSFFLLTTILLCFDHNIHIHSHIVLSHDMQATDKKTHNFFETDC